MHPPSSLRHSARLACAALSAVGCSAPTSGLSGDAGAPSTADAAAAPPDLDAHGFVAAFARLSCASAARCGWVRAADLELCAQVEESRWYLYLDRVEAREWRLDEARAAECLAAVAAACGPVELPAPCRASLVGAVPLGGACTWREDCADGHWCSIHTRRCERRAALGEPCEGRPCADRNALCDPRHGCLGQASLGEACGTFAPCTLGECATEGGASTCAPRALGEPCVADVECTSLNCAAQVCAAATLCAPCAQHDDCARDAYCDRGACAARLGADAPCVDGDECAGSVCADARCLPHTRGSCEHDSDCVSRLCSAVVSGWCLPTPSPGSVGPGGRCRDAADCAEGRGCVGGACLASAALGEACGVGARCEGATLCDREVCRARPREGDDCARWPCASFDEALYPLSCEAGRCVATRRPAGAACDPLDFMSCVGECDPARRACVRRPL